MSNATRHAHAFARRVASIHPALERAVNRVGVTALSVSKKKMTELIYAKPIPTSRSGKPQWRRTGRLRRGEEVDINRDMLEVTLVNRVEYAEPRHEAGKPGRRNTQFPAHWRDETVEAMRPIIPDIVRAEMLKVLGGSNR